MLTSYEKLIFSKKLVSGTSQRNPFINRVNSWDDVIGKYIYQANELIASTLFTSFTSIFYNILCRCHIRWQNIFRVTYFFFLDFFFFFFTSISLSITSDISLMGIYSNDTSVHLLSRKLTKFHVKPLYTWHVSYTSLKNKNNKNNKKLNFKNQEN
jgi:hypothetical protein